MMDGSWQDLWISLKQHPQPVLQTVRLRLKKHLKEICLDWMFFSDPHVDVATNHLHWQLGGRMAIAMATAMATAPQQFMQTVDE